MMPRLIWFLLVFLFSQVKSQCPQHFQEQPGTGYCYGIFEDELSGTEADTKCDEKVAAYPGVGRLASIRDKLSWEWIKTKLATMASITTGIWIGLYDTGNDAFAWRDGRPFCPWITNDSLNCGPNNPWIGFPNGKNQRPGQESCVTLHQRVWNETDCSLKFQYYCVKIKPASGACPGGTIAFPPGHCLLNVESPDNFSTFTEAGQNCVAQGLSYLWPAKEQALTDGLTAAWTYHQPLNVWIGLRGDGSGNYYWMDKPTEIGLRKNTFWSTGQPNGGVNAEQCVFMTAQNWMWADEDCSRTMPYICQYQVVAIERGKAYLSPNDTSCESPTKNLLKNLTKTMALSDGNSNTFIKPFSGTGATKYRVLVELFELWRSHPVVTLKGSNLHCLPADGISVVLLLDNRKVNCYLYLPDGTPAPNGPTDKCSYWCDRVMGMVNYISVSFRKAFDQLEIVDVSIVDQAL